eukprot:tig00021489_g21651.t1
MADDSRSPLLRPRPGHGLGPDAAAELERRYSKLSSSAVGGGASDLPPIRVLSIDGGGAKGIIPAKLIEYISARAGRPIHELFDVVAGTSAGALIAGACFGLRDGRPLIPAESLVATLMKKWIQAFPSYSAPVALARAIRGPIFSDSTVLGILKEFGGDCRLADTGAFLVIPTYDIEERCPVYFSTSQALADPDAHNFLLPDVVHAAVAAPAILAPVRLHCPGVYAHKDYSTFVDGCLTQNNPALIAHAEASRLFPGRRILMVSLGTGSADVPMNSQAASRWNAFKWLVPAIECMLDGTGDCATDLAESLLGDNFIRLSPRLPPGLDSVADARPQQLQALCRTVEKQLLRGEPKRRLDAFIERLVAASDHPRALPRPSPALLPPDFVVVPKQPAVGSQPAQVLSDIETYGTCHLTFDNASFSVKEAPPPLHAQGAAERARKAGAALARSVSESIGLVKHWRHVLAPISGELRPGTMTCVLGPAFSGKTALLQILANRDEELRRAGRVGGAVRLNGAPARSSAAFARRVVLVRQDDASHYPQLTVEEALSFAARMRRPSGGERDAADVRDAHAMTLTAAMVVNLVQAMDSLVGDQNVRGISGGEKRRLTVAVELVAGGKGVVLLDQPTDGLDAAASLDLCRALRSLAESGVAVICSLLQPSWEVYSLFDELILLAPGRCVYQGPGGLAPVRHFEGQGLKNVDALSPPDFLVSVASTGRAQLATSLSSSDARVALKVEPTRAPLFDEDPRAPIASRAPPAGALVSASSVDLNVAPEIDLQRQYAAPAKKQFDILYERFNTLLFRNRRPLISRTVQSLAIAFILGTLFCQMPATASGAVNRISFLQACLLVYAFMALSKIDINYENRRVMHAQTQEGAYRPELWLAANVASEVPRLFVEVTLFSLVAYHAAGLQVVATHQRFARFLLVLFQMSLVADASVLALCQVFAVREVCSSLAPILPALSFIFGGFVVPRPSLPSWWKWARYWSYFSYPHEALCLNELWDLAVDGRPGGGAAVLEAFGMSADPAWYWYNVLISLAYWLAWLAAALLGARFSRPRRAFPSVMGADAHAHAPSPSPPPEGEGAWKAPPAPAPAELEMRSRGAAGSAGEGMLVHVVTVERAHGAGGLESPGHGQPRAAALTFRGLCYDVPAERPGEPPRRLLENVSGFVRGGGLTVLMGASGAGKTTLIDVLAGRKTTGTVTGEIRLNGRPLPPNGAFARVSSYVEQFDLLFPTMTVREAVVLSAMVRLDAAVPRREKLAAAEWALRELDLEAAGGLVIGTLEAGGIPVEMRKRTCIAMELVPRPHVLFLDEPTTGLDSTAALRVGKLLRRIASGGQATVATIHQPSQPLFALFDYLILLKRGGVPVFCGELGERCSGVLAFFAQLGYDLPPFRNPADFVIETAGGRSGRRAAGQAAPRATPSVSVLSEAAAAAAAAPPSRTRMNRAAEEIAAQFKASPLAATLQAQLSELEASLSAQEAPRIPQRPGFARQVGPPPLRAPHSPNFAPRPGGRWRCCNLLVALIAGTTWYQLGLDQPSARLRLSAMYCITLYFYFRAIGDITSHCALREVYYRERAQGLVSPIAHQASSLIVMTSFHVLNAIAFVAIAYPLCGFQLQGRMGYAVLLACLWTLVNSAFIEFLALALPIPPVVFSVASAILACGAFFTGFMISGSDIPRPWIWFFYLLWFRYPFEGLAANELSNIAFAGCPPQAAAAGLCFPTGAAVLARYDLSPDRQWANLGILAAFWAAFEAGKALALHRITHLRR